MGFASRLRRKITRKITRKHAGSRGEKPSDDGAIAALLRQNKFIAQTLEELKAASHSHLCGGGDIEAHAWHFCPELRRGCHKCSICGEIKEDIEAIWAANDLRGQINRLEAERDALVAGMHDKHGLVESQEEGRSIMPGAIRSGYR